MDDFEAESIDRNKLRKKYRGLIKKAKKCVEDNDESGINDISNKLKKIYLSVRYPREAVLDINVLSHLANYGVRRVESLRTSLMSFDSNHFINAILSMPNDQYQSIFPTSTPFTPKINFILPHFIKQINVTDPNEGTCDGGSQKKVVRTASKRSLTKSSQFDPVKVAKIMDNSDGEDEILGTGGDNKDASSKKIIRIFKIIKSLVNKSSTNSCCLFEILNYAKDFSQAIEFNFYLAFLASDGRIKVNFTDNPINPRISSSQLIDAQNITKNKLNNANKQVVFVFNHTIYQQMLQFNNKKTPEIDI